MLIALVITIITVICIYVIYKMAKSIYNDLNFHFITGYKKIVFFLITAIGIGSISFIAILAFMNEVTLIPLIVTDLAILAMCLLGIIFIYFSCLERDYF